MRHLASFRVRVFLLTALVAVAATAATAWLTVRDASSQINDSVTAERETVDALSTELSGYAVQHGTWEGVTSLVKDLTRRSGQRLRLTTLAGEVVVDSEHLAGRRASAPSPAPPRVLQPRPAITLDGLSDAQVYSVTAGLIDRYRWHVRWTACLTRLGVAVPRPWPDEYGVPLAAVPKTRLDVATASRCLDQTATTDGERRADTAAILTCYRGVTVPSPGHSPSPSPPPPGGQERDASDTVQRCAAEAFATRIEAVAPVPLLLYLGVDRQGDLAEELSLTRALTAAGIVALVVVAGTLLLGRRVVRPISTITAASRRLGAGDLSGRVAVRGHDEVAELARTFNRMAEQLQRAEERQRRMVGDIAHELRTPLANLRGYLEALSDGVLAPTPELFVSLHEEAVLQQRIRRRPAGTGARGGRCAAVPQRRRRHRRPAGELPRRTPGDSRRPRRDIAGRGGCRPDGGRRLRPVAPSRREPRRQRAERDTARRVGDAAGYRSGDQVAVDVTDTGYGIAQEDQAKVFDRFWRADAARGRRTGGSGLGLAITREFVVAHGGAVTVASERGVGTTFAITLPAAPVAPQAR